MYVRPNYATKRDLIAGLSKGDKVTIFQPGSFGGNEPKNAQLAVEGPHHPEPHKWYASIVIKDGYVTKVK